MALPTFYYPDLDETLQTLQLTDDEARHAQAARRLRAGARINLINGQGLRAIGSITSIDRRHVDVALESFQQFKRPARQVTIICAIPKGDRQRTMLEMLTQIGVTRIIALRCERSVTRPEQRQQQKWQRYVIEACKQSGNLWLPEIAPPVELAELSEALEHYNFDHVFYAAQDGHVLHRYEEDPVNVGVVIGPEGGFSEQELLLLQQLDLSGLALGEHILRTETAAVLAAAACVNTVDFQAQGK